MMRILLAAIALGALALSPAMAQQDHRPGGHNGPHAGPSHGGGQAPAHAMHRSAFSTVHRGTTHVVAEHRHGTVYRTHVHHVEASHHHVVSHRAMATHRAVASRRTMHNVHAVAARHAANVRELHRNFTASHRFHNGAYVRPAGWYAHRWVYGERLPVAWYGRSYWIVNFPLFGLIYPPDGYEWIRVGDDALLVDIDTGEIIRVEYAVFF
jgi:Ni/Co efflux regulator RcnB